LHRSLFKLVDILNHSSRFDKSLQIIFIQTIFYYLL
jgi:hypothetical protein